MVAVIFTTLSGKIVVSHLTERPSNLIILKLKKSSQLSVRLLLLYSVFNDHLFVTLLSYLVGSSGLEPPTSRLSGARSNQLSYEPIVFAGAYCLILFPWWR